MKKAIYSFFLCGVVLLGSSCKKYLDVNEVNPNSPTAATVDLILPQALAATAAATFTFDQYGAWVGGVQANAGGIGGFGAVLTYNYTTSDDNGLWSQSYNNINDYQYIINNTTADGDYKYFNGAARIMKAFAYQRLVDLYGDVPYTEAVKGLSNLTPKYDKAEDIYTSLLTVLDSAIVSMKSPATSTTVALGTGTNGKVDVLFGGDVTQWVKFANTIKLRMLLRIQKVSSLSAAFNAGKAKLENNFLTTNAIVQPGYAAGQDGKQNPAWNALIYNASGTSSNNNFLPTKYAVGFYDGNKIVDDFRGELVYKDYNNSNRLGITTSDVPTAPPGGPWFTGDGSGTSASGYGIFKGPAMGTPIMLAAESYFLQAEGNLIGLVSGAAETNFDNGIQASMDYLDRDASLALRADDDLGEALTTYQTDNAGNYLVDYSSATSDEERLEAIITQKWIAMNRITSNEGWAEYRRTDYPRTTPSTKFPGVATPVNSFASAQSTSPRPDKLPVRVLYPSSEYSLNPANAPGNINAFTSRIFWDAN